MPIKAPEARPLEITTINNYFSQIYSEKDLETFYTTLNDKFLSYKFPLEICLSSTFQFSNTLLGTLTFQQLDINGYPTYTGDVTKSSEGFFNIIYSTTLNFVTIENRWIFILTTEIEGVSDITINSVRTTSLNPTKVDYNEISRPTSGACPR